MGEDKKFYNAHKSIRLLYVHAAIHATDGLIWKKLTKMLMEYRVEW